MVLARSHLSGIRMLLERVAGEMRGLIGADNEE